LKKKVTIPSGMQCIALKAERALLDRKKKREAETDDFGDRKEGSARF